MLPILIVIIMIIAKFSKLTDTLAKSAVPEANRQFGNSSLPAYISISHNSFFYLFSGQ